MLKMGQMCHCKATLWRIDPSTGEIQWSADRGANSFCLSAYDDSSNVYLHEGGTVTSQGNRATQWRDDTTFATRVWNAALSGTPNIGETASDGNPWFSNMFRLDSFDGSTLSSATLSNSPFLYIKYAPSGEMYVFSSTGASLRLVDTSVSVTATISSVRLWPVRLAAGWFACLTTAPRLMRTYDDGLTQIASASQPLLSAGNILNPCHLESDSGKVFCIETSGGAAAQWTQIDSSGLSADWAISPLSSYADGFPAAVVADGDVFVMANKNGSGSSGGVIIARLSGVDGSTVWSNTYSGGSATGTMGLGYELVFWNDTLIGMGNNGANGSDGGLLIDGSTATYLFALDADTGDTIWARGNEGVGGFARRPRIENDTLYVAGTRGKRATVPNIVSV